MRAAGAFPSAPGRLLKATLQGKRELRRSTRVGGILGGEGGNGWLEAKSWRGGRQMAAAGLGWPGTDGSPAGPTVVPMATAASVALSRTIGKLATRQGSLCASWLECLAAFLNLLDLPTEVYPRGLQRCLLLAGTGWVPGLFCFCV